MAGYFGPLLAWMDLAVAEGLLKPANRRLVLAATEPAELFDLLERWRPVPVDKWIAPGLDGSRPGSTHRASGDAEQRSRL